MPDKEGKLTAEEKKKAVAWLDAHAQSTCPACGTKEWSLAEHLINLMAFTPPVFRIGGPTYPAILLVCQRCGYFRMHSAIMAGVIPAEKTQEAKSGA